MKLSDKIDDLLFHPLSIFLLVVAMTMAYAHVYAAEQDPTPPAATDPVIPVKEETIFSTDLEAAKARAAKEGKDLFVICTGSDWCPNCKALEKDVLMKKEFADGVAKKWVCVIIDYPQTFELSKELFIQNSKFGRDFAISGVPTLVIMDPKGKVFGYCRGISGDVPAVLKCLDEMLEIKKARDVAFAAAEKAATPEIAAMLYNNALNQLFIDAGVFQGWSLFGYDDIVDKIIAADPKNVHHCKVVWLYRKYVIVSKDAFDANDFVAAIKPMDDFVKEFPNEKIWTQTALYSKAQLQARNNDLPGCLKTLKEIIALDATSQIAIESQKVIDRADAFQKEQSEKK